MEEDIKIVHFTGWHGTDRKNAEEILKNNFLESSGNHHWLGEGVYFFGEGLGKPVIHAAHWAKSEAYKKGYREFAVLEADIAVNDTAILDLREDAGLELFNQHRNFVLRKIRDAHRGFRVPKKAYHDSKVFEHMKQIAGLEVFIMNFYVQFLQDRIEKIESKFPNCTFLCVSNPKDNIDQDTIKILGVYNI